jgi:hypothetical protein
MNATRAAIERELIVHGAVPADASQTFIEEHGEALDLSEDGGIANLNDAIERYRASHPEDFIALRPAIYGRSARFVDAYKAVLQARDRAESLKAATARALSPARRAQKRGQVNYGAARSAS